MQDGCLNCGGTIFPGQHYCAVCGQRTNTRRLTIRQLLQDSFQAIVNIERSIVRLLKGLLLRPGVTAAEYAEGKRKRYFPPFAFMALCIAAMVLFNSWMKPYITVYEPDQKVLARIHDPETKAKYLRTIERNNYLQRITNKNLNTASVLAAPFYAVFLFWFFRRRGRNIAEIIVAYILFAAFSNIVSTLLFSPILGNMPEGFTFYAVQVTSFILQTAYMAWGMRDFFGLKKTKGFITMFAALSLVGIIGFILLMIGFFLYVYQGSYDILKYL